MNKYVRKLFGVMFQGQQTQSAVHAPLHDLPMSPEEWHQHWQSQGQSWRTEPEIDTKRQEELSKHRVIIPDIEKGIYSFKGMKLSRADIEWLLATHENGRGLVDWSDESQRGREGLDLRGADLRGMNLNNLPLTRFRGGLTRDELYQATEEQIEKAAVHMEGTLLRGAHLEAAILRGAHLENADLRDASLEKANLGYAQLKEAEFRRAQLKEVSLSFANLEGTLLWETNLEGADFSAAWGENVNLSYAQLGNANLYSAYLGNANLFGTQLQNADLGSTQLKNAMLGRAHLEGVNLANADLENANLYEARLVGANLRGASLEIAILRSVEMTRTDLRSAYFERTILSDITLGDEKLVGPFLADAQWNTVNLTEVKWSQVKLLGDEHEAKQKITDGKVKDKNTRIKEYEDAVRANRQLAVVLQNQGLDEDANRFAYRAKILQRKLLWKQRNFWKWLGSMMLALLAGYGYRMWHIIAAYILIVLLCAVAYFVLGMYYQPHLSFLEAVLTSITAFHGRVFSEPFLRSDDPQLWVTAFEAVTGIVIEGVFIAMLTQKFFGK